MEQWITQFLSEHGSAILYFGTFGLLVICGFGIPLPEEGTFLIAGYAAHTQGFNQIEMGLLCIVGVLGILVGDSVPFYLGKRYGLELLTSPRFSAVMTPQRVEWVRDHFHRWGNWTVFFARFVAGFRMPTFFMAATMGVSYRKFLLLDFFGAILSCPISIFLAWYFGQQAKEMMARSHVYIYIAIGLAVAYFVYHYYSHRTPKPCAPELKDTPATPTSSEKQPGPEAQIEQPARK